MSDFDDLMGSFNQTPIEKTVVNETEEIQTDEEIDFVPGVVEEEPEEAVEVAPVVQAPKVFYGTHGKAIEDESFRESFRACFLENLRDIEWFDDFVVFVSEIEDKEKRSLIHKVAKEFIANNETKQYEFLLRYGMPVMIYQARSALADWSSEITKPLEENNKRLNLLMTAIGNAESTSIASIRENAIQEIERLREFGDQIVKREVAASKGRVSENEKALELAQKRIEELLATVQTELQKKEVQVLNKTRKSVEDVLGAASDAIVEEHLKRVKEATENDSPVKKFLFYAAASFSGMYAFAVIMKHFPNFVF